MKALKRDVSHLESQAEQDPDYYGPLLLKAQGDLTAATEALQRAKPVGSQLQACLSRKRQLEKSVEGLGAELEALEDMVRDKKEEHEAAVIQLEAQAAELRRLTLLSHEADPVVTNACPTTTAIMALLTPELSASLLASLALLQSQAGLVSGPILTGLGKTGIPPTPTGGGTVTPRAGQGAVTPRQDAAGSSTPKARSRSPSARAEAVEAGTRPGGLIEGLVLLQTVLGLAAGRRPELIPVEDDSMSTEL